jgi:hypothetical protein
MRSIFLFLGMCIFPVPDPHLGGGRGVSAPVHTSLATTQKCFPFYPLHRVDRVLSFLSSRPKWDPPPPSTQASVYLLWFPGEAHSLAGEGVETGEVPIPTRGQTKWYSRYIGMYLVITSVYCFLSTLGVLLVACRRLV